MGYWRLLHDLADTDRTDWSATPIVTSCHRQFDRPTHFSSNTDKRPFRRLIMTGAAASVVFAMAIAPLVAQQPGLSIQTALTSLVGVVGDSLHGGPLVGAVVMIDANSRTAVTDSIGRFRIDSIPPGQYRVAIYHPIVDSLGISLVTAPIDFESGKPLLVSLAIPSGNTIRQTICSPPSESSGMDPNAGPAVLVGRVLDPENETAMPNVTVTLEWTATASGSTTAEAVPQRRDAVTGDDGRFCLCALPAGLSGTLRAAFQSAPELTVERKIVLEKRIITMAALHLPRISPSTPVEQRDRAVLMGSVIRSDGSPVPHATISLDGTQQSTTSGRDGAFALRGLPAGTRTISVHSVGFDPIEQVVELAARAPGRVVLTLSPAARLLNPVVVSTQRLQAGYARVGFDRRRQAGLGEFFTADDIAKRHALYFSDFLNGSPQIHMNRGPSAPSFDNDRDPGPCLTYVVDGHPLANRGEGDVDALFRAGQIVGIEIYSDIAVPSEFRMPGLLNEHAHGVDGAASGGCATIVVWTKGHIIGDPSP